MHCRPPLKTEDIISRFAAVKSITDLRDAASTLAYEFQKPCNDPTKVISNEALVDTLLDAMEIKQEQKDSDWLFTTYTDLSLNLNHIFARQDDIENNPNYADKGPKLDLKADVIDRLWKALESCEGTAEYHNYAAGVFRNMQTFFSGYPEYSNQPETYDRLLKHVTGPYPLYARTVALDAINEMVGEHPDLADRPTGLHYDADKKVPMSLLDIAQALAFGEDKWGDGKPLDERFRGTYASSNPLVEISKNLFYNLSSVRPQHLTSSTIQKVIIDKDDPWPLAEKKAMMFLHMSIGLAGQKGTYKHVIPDLVNAYHAVGHLATIYTRDLEGKPRYSAARIQEGILEYLVDLPINQPSRTKAPVASVQPSTQPHPV